MFGHPIRARQSLPCRKGSFEGLSARTKAEKRFSYAVDVAVFHDSPISFSSHIWAGFYLVVVTTTTPTIPQEWIPFLRGTSLDELARHLTRLPPIAHFSGGLRSSRHVVGRSTENRRWMRTFAPNSSVRDVLCHAAIKEVSREECTVFSRGLFSVANLCADYHFDINTKSQRITGRPRIAGILVMLLRGPRRFCARLG